MLRAPAAPKACAGAKAPAYIFCLKSLIKKILSLDVYVSYALFAPKARGIARPVGEARAGRRGGC